ncbi:MAG: hypothetical protein KF715_09690 [Candidatus Didemnitutus sp.]|nr:hypothetical protein [Candidatus Didemnitutus sp.]
MRRLIALVLALFAARLGAADGEWTRSVDGTIESKFVRRGIERAGASVRQGAWLANEEWKFGAWVNVPFTARRWSEFGVLAAYTHTFGESGPTLGLQVTHYHLADAYEGHPAHAGEVAASFSFPAGPGRVTASVTRDVSRRADMGELGYGGEYALKDWGAFLNYRLYVGAVEADNVLPELGGPRIEDSYSYHGIDLTLPYRIGGQTVVTAGLHYAGTDGARPFWSPGEASPGGKIWFSLAASYEF